jgi:exodeoxyribonuclease VII large subunit
LVTSSTGAAIRDALHVIQRRHAGLEIVLASCRVQGQGAAQEIACAIALLNDFSAGALPVRGLKPRPQPLDLILITRGGGSLEDLWAFNEEVVARAVHASVLPVISAIGHEIDFTICDFVADFRAATPSAAAELVTDGVYSSREFLAQSSTLLLARAQRQLTWRREEVLYALGRLERMHPRHWIREQWQILDDLQIRLARCARKGWREKEAQFEKWNARLTRVGPRALLRRGEADLQQLERRLRRATTEQLRRRTENLKMFEGRLALLLPSNVLQRGYSITTEASTGRIIRSSTEAQDGALLITRLKDGSVSSRVELTPRPARSRKKA